ncbi:MAG TPA: hypothetical protein ENN13_03590 [Candidatus Altiarchaeales archaeon]|nr:hypothetical protein [Candidatus Altiarchaeales archaeon]
MKREIVVVGGPDLTYGFRLAGVGETIIIDESDSTRVGELSRINGKIIFISQKALELAGGHAEILREKNIVQVIPANDYSTVKDLIKNTIGFDVHVK